MEVINNSSVQVKVAFNEDLRRFSIPKDASFQHLASNIVHLFNIAPNANFVVRYVDNDQDQITMSSDGELREAMSVAQDGIIRLSVVIKDSVPNLMAISPAAPSRFGVPPHPVHHGPFRGGRRHHQHHRAMVGPLGHPTHHDMHGLQGPHPCRDKAMWKRSKEERKTWKHEQCKMWREQKKTWKAYWQSLSKEERDQLKEQKKDLKRQWKTDTKANLGDQSGKPRHITRHVQNVSIPLEGPVVPDQEVADVIAPMNAPKYEPGVLRMITDDGEVKFGQDVWEHIMQGMTGASSSSSSSSDDAETRYGSTAKMIEAMGFDVKRKRIVRMLGKHDGDVDKVVQILTKRTKALQL